LIATQIRRRRRLVIGGAFVGVLVAAIFFAYFETDPRPGSPAALAAGMLALVLCPGSLFFATWIDIEPQTSAFAVMWFIIGVSNAGLYALIGLVVSQLGKKGRSEP
jgi:hypothetical protein